MRKKKEEDDKVMNEIRKVKEEMKEWQFYLMGEKQIMSVGNTLTGIIKLIGNSSINQKLKEMKVEKLEREKEKNQQLMLQMQKLTETFLSNFH